MNVENRIDQNKAYICFAIGVCLLAGIATVVGVPRGAMEALRISPGTQLFLSATLFISSLLSVNGFTLGTRYLREHTDIRWCYRLGVWGNGGLASILWVYAVLIVRAAQPNVVYSLGQAIWPLLLGLGFGLTGCDLLKEIHRTEMKIPYVLRGKGSAA